MWSLSKRVALSPLGLLRHNVQARCGGGGIVGHLRDASSDANANADANADPERLSAADLAAELSKLKMKSHLSDLGEFREDLPSIAKSLFLGRFPTKVLSFPDVLPNDRYFSLEKR